MAKGKRSESQPAGTNADGYEVLDPEMVQQLVRQFVDYAEEHKIPARHVMVAMEYIVNKIKSHLGVQTVTPHDGTDTKH